MGRKDAEIIKTWGKRTVRVVETDDQGKKRVTASMGMDSNTSPADVNRFLARNGHTPGRWGRNSRGNQTSKLS